MKTLALLCLIPFQIFCCQDCEERIQEKMDYTICEINHEMKKDKHRNKQYINFLYGKFEAYWECLHLIQHQGS